MFKLLINSKSTVYNDYPVVGFYWWDMYDSDGEALNWGLVTPSDNPYDGNSATVSGLGSANGKDLWGYRTGGERANYGDFLSGIKAANDSANTTTLPGSKADAVR